MLKLRKCAAGVILALSLLCAGIAWAATQSLDLKAGFNFVSFAVLPGVTPSQFLSANPQVKEIYLYNQASGSFIGSGLLPAFEAGAGYIVKADADVSAGVTGNDVAQVGFLDLKAGFNLVGISKAVTSVKFSEVMNKYSFIQGIYHWHQASGTFVQVVRSGTGQAELLDGTDPVFEKNKSYFIKLSKDARIYYDDQKIDFFEGGAAPVPAEIAANVQSANYKEYLNSLSTSQNDKRGYDEDKNPQNGLASARAYIKERLAASLGESNVTLQNFTTQNGYSCVNIIGTLPGSDPTSSYIIDAHYDSVENPGADDNASGVAGVLEAARVMSKYKFKTTIIFVLLDYEEYRSGGGTMGSLDYVRTNSADAGKVKGVISMDMIAYHPADDWSMTLSRDDTNTGSSSDLLMRDLVSAYGTYSTLKVGSQYVGFTSSDAVNFYRAGYASVLVSERMKDDGWPISTYYHQPADFYIGADGLPQKCNESGYIDIEYASQIVKGVVGWASASASPSERRAAGMRMISLNSGVYSRM